MHGGHNTAERRGRALRGGAYEALRVPGAARRSLTSVVRHPGRPLVWVGAWGRASSLPTTTPAPICVQTEKQAAPLLRWCTSTVKQWVCVGPAAAAIVIEDAADSRPC